jgi:hypothetical protein
MDLPIKSITDLRLEIDRLRALEQQQGTAIARRFSSPAATFSTIFSLFSGSPSGDGTKSSSFFDQDIVGLLSRFILPFTLNKTIFRNSNFLVKALVGLVSQKASHFINEDAVAGIWDKIKTLFHRKVAEETPEHKGVPAFSETY